MKDGVAEDVCRCTLAQRMVGDGCEVCNPELAEEIRRQNEADAMIAEGEK